MKKILIAGLIIVGFILMVGMAIVDSPLKIIQTVDPTTVMYSDKITYTITISNVGSDNVDNVHLFDSLPLNDTAFVKWVEKPAGVARLGNAFSWVGIISAYQTYVFSFVARYVGNGGEVANTAILTHNGETYEAIATFQGIGYNLTYLPLVVHTIPSPTPVPPTPEPVKNALEITTLQYAGRNEFIEITNNGPGLQSLDDWSILSVVGSQIYYFPNNVVLNVGDRLSIHSGPDAGGGLIWSFAYIWNNNGDGAKLYDNAGDIRATKCYLSGC